MSDLWLLYHVDVDVAWVMRRVRATICCPNMPFSPAESCVGRPFRVRAYNLYMACVCPCRTYILLLYDTDLCTPEHSDNSQSSRKVPKDTNREPQQHSVPSFLRKHHDEAFPHFLLCKCLGALDMKSLDPVSSFVGLRSVPIRSDLYSYLPFLNRRGRAKAGVSS